MSLRAPISDLPLFRSSDTSAPALGRQRTGDGPPTSPVPTPEQSRDAVLDQLERKRRGYIVRLRTELELLFRKRFAHDPDAYVTADDAREIFERWPSVPPPEELSRNFMGSLFRGRRWVEVGTCRSRTPGRNASIVRKWRLKVDETN